MIYITGSHSLGVSQVDVSQAYNSKSQDSKGTANSMPAPDLEIDEPM